MPRAKTDSQKLVVSFLTAKMDAQVKAAMKRKQIEGHNRDDNEPLPPPPKMVKLEPVKTFS